MAITLAGTFEGQGVDGAAVTVTLTGTATGDVVYGFQHTAVGTGTAPTGYTLLESGNDGENSTFYAYRKVLSAADASVQFSAGDVDVGNACVVVVLRGVDNTTPEDATTTKASGGGAPNSPSITTTTAGALVISAFGGSSAVTGITAPVGYSNQVDIFSNGDAGAVTCGAASIEVASPAAENPAAWTDITVAGYVAVTIAARAATAGDAGRLVSSGVGAASFVGKWTASGAVSASGAATVLFFAEGASSSVFAATGGATVSFMGTSTGGSRPQLPGVSFRGIRQSGPVVLPTP